MGRDDSGLSGDFNVCWGVTLDVVDRPLPYVRQTDSEASRRML